MSDRGLPPDASLACPFVAFEDDRDGRSTRPDHRHRCFAELRPAPRATAHQAAYCLSAGFATCPTFMDWARREAARVRAPAEPAPAGPSPTADRGAPSVARTVQDEVEPWPYRDPRRDWAAPPPWAASTAGAAAAAAGSDEAAATREEPRPAAEALPSSAETSGVEAPAFLASRPPEPSRPPAGGSTPMPPAAPSTSRSRPAYPPPDLDDELEAGTADEDSWAEPPSDDRQMRRFGPAAGRTRYDDTASRSGSPPPRRRPPADPGAPSWEKPRRYEAYPTLRTRAGLPPISPLLAAGAVIVLGALALFFIPPMLLGLGGGGSASPTPSGSGASASATPIASPTAVPSPTPVVYVVKTGDTLSKIARQYGVSLDDLIAANKATLPDPDKLQPGDQLIIPVAPPEPSPSPDEASPSP